MNKRTWWKSVAALVVCGAGLALADSPKVETPTWTRSSVPVLPPEPAKPIVVPASASIPVSRPLPEQTPPPPLAKPVPLPDKASSDDVVLPKFKAVPPSQPVIQASATLPPAESPTAPLLPPIVTPPAAPSSSNKVPITVIPPPSVAVPTIPPTREAAKPLPTPKLSPPTLKLPGNNLEKAIPTPKPATTVTKPSVTPPTIPEFKAVKPEVAKPAIPPLPELAPPAQSAKSADPVKPIPPASADFNLRPAPGSNSVKSKGPETTLPVLPVVPPMNPGPMLTVPPPLPMPTSDVAHRKPVDGPMPATEKFVFPIPDKAPPAATLEKPKQVAIPATLPRVDMPEVPLVPQRPPVPPAVPMMLPGVPTSIERPTAPHTNLTTIPTPGVDPMISKQTTLASVIGGALALMPAAPASALPLPPKPMTPALTSPVKADPPAKTADEKLAEAQREIRRLAELIDGRKDTDGRVSPVDIGAVEEIKRLKDKIFQLNEKVLGLERQLDELKKNTTSLKPNVTPPAADPMQGKGTVRIENEYPIEITLVVNTMSYRVPANTKLDVTVPMGEFTYQLLNSGTSLAPVKSPIKEKEVVRLRIK